MSDLNDPRVLFAAERTLMAWNRTSLTLMAFGFVIERFGLFVQMLFAGRSGPIQGNFAFWIGLAFILLGSIASAFSIIQFRKVLRSLRPIEIPEEYNVNFGCMINAAIAILGVALTIHLLMGR